jgi:hypothetical protein
MRLCERLDVDAETASQTYYACLLMYVGCTADAGAAAELFGDDALLREFASRAPRACATARRCSMTGACSTSPT